MYIKYYPSSLISLSAANWCYSDKKLIAVILGTYLLNSRPFLDPCIRGRYGAIKKGLASSESLYVEGVTYYSKNISLVPLKRPSIYISTEYVPLAKAVPS